MKPQHTGSGHLYLFLLASLLVHLGIGCAVSGGRVGAGDREQPPAAVIVEYLDLGTLAPPAAPSRGDAAGAAASAPPSYAGRAAALSAATPPSEARPPVPREAPGDRDAKAPPAGVIEAGGREDLKAPAVTVATGSRESKASSFAPGPAGGDRGTVETPGSADSAGAGTGEGPVAATSRQRGGGGARREGDSSTAREGYQQRLKSLIESHKKYPLAARRSRQQGSCVRRFALGRDGSLKSVESITSCGHPFLDGAATSAITSVGSFPPLPVEFGAEESFSVTITFTLAGS